MDLRSTPALIKAIGILLIIGAAVGGYLAVRSLTTPKSSDLGKEPMPKASEHGVSKSSLEEGYQPPPTTEPTHATSKSSFEGGGEYPEPPPPEHGVSKSSLEEGYQPPATTEPTHAESVSSLR